MSSSPVTGTKRGSYNLDDDGLSARHYNNNYLTSVVQWWQSNRVETPSHVAVVPLPCVLPSLSGMGNSIGLKPLRGPHTINIINSVLDSDGIIDRVLWELMKYNYGKTILMNDENGCVKKWIRQNLLADNDIDSVQWIMMTLQYWYCSIGRWKSKCMPRISPSGLFLRGFIF